MIFLGAYLHGELLTILNQDDAKLIGALKARGYAVMPLPGQGLS